MAQVYASKTLNKIDERYTTESKTQIIINKGMTIEMTGVKTATIYNVDTVAEGNYTRSGANRFGALVELGVGVQEVTLTQDKAWTFTVDQGNLKDSMHAQEVHKAVKRQTREVSIPTTDIYRLAVLSAYATAQSQQAVAAVTNTNIYAKLLEHQAQMDEDEVPEEGRVCFITPTSHNLLKRDPEFRKDCDKSYRDAKKGIIGMVDSLTLVKLPSSYFVANFAFMIVHEGLMVSPTKMKSVRVLTDVQGIDGSVAEGRRYYDAWLLEQKGKAVRQHLIV